MEKIWVTAIIMHTGDQRDSITSFREVKFHPDEVSALRELNTPHHLMGSRYAVEVAAGQSLDAAWKAHVGR